MRAMSNSAIGYFGYVLLALVTLIITTGVHLLSWFNIGWDIHLFDGRTREAWRRHSLPVIADSWLIYVWAGVYALQLPWLMHVIGLLLRRLPDIGYLFTRPCLLPPSAMLCSMAGHGSVLGWLSLWCSSAAADSVATERLYRFAPLCLVGASLFNYGALAIADNALRKHIALLCAFDARAEACVMRVLAHNGLAAMGAWTTVVALYSAAALAVDASLLSADRASYVCLGLIAAYVAVFFLLDVGLSLTGARWLVTPYLMASIALVAAVLETNSAWQHDKAVEARNQLMTSAVLLALSCIASLIKMTMAICRRDAPQRTVSQYGIDGDGMPAVEIAHL